MKAAIRIGDHFCGRDAALALLLLLTAPVAFGVAIAAAEQARHPVLDQAPDQDQPTAGTMPPDAQRKDQRDGAERSVVGDVRSSTAAKDPNAPDAKDVSPDARRTLLERHDWDAHFRLPAKVSAGLQLPIAVPEHAARGTGVYQFGSPYYLYIGLKNYESARRVLDAVPACGTLARADTLTFRVVSDGGAELVLPNRYKDREELHVHPPLIIDGGATLVGLVDFNEFVATSGELFALVKNSKRLTVTAEIPGVRVKSNTLNVELGR
jgi:hypothetical protein